MFSAELLVSKIFALSPFVHMLCSIFPLCSDQKQPQGWWFKKGSSQEISEMDPYAALTFNPAEQYLTNILPPVTRSHLAP